MVQLRSLLQGQQLNQQFLQSNQLKLEQAQRGQQEQQQVDQMIAKHKGDLRAALPEIMKVSPRSGRELQTWLTNWDRQDTQKKLEVLNLSIKKTVRKAQLASGVRDQSSYEAAVNKGLQEQLYDQPTAQKMLSDPYDPKNVRAIQRQALTSQQWFEQEQNRLNAERSRQQDARNAPEKVYDFLARTMGTVRSQSEWTAKRNFAQARLRKMGVSEDYMDLIEEEYSPEAAQQVKQLGIEPKEEKKPTTPFAAFASGDPEEQKLARQWIALQNRYRQATGNQKRQLDSINARFNREMQVVKAQIEPTFGATEQQKQRMEAILRKANEDYDAVVGGKAPKERAQAGKTATREEVEAFAQEKGISYAEAKQQYRTAGYTIQ